jgi:hypothetical protein
MARISDVLEWLDRQGDTHFGSNGRLYRTAVGRFVSQQVQGEPDSAEWIAENLDVLARRLAKSDHVNSSSLRTYLSRARSALSAYEDWSQNPIGWSPKGRKSGPLTPSGRKVPEKVTKATEAALTLHAKQMSRPENTLEDEISEALRAIAHWPKLRPFLMEGLAKAMQATEATHSMNG